MKIVLTGGPSAGKTSIAEIIVGEFPQKLIFVEEAASLLFRAGFPRNSYGEYQKHQQLAIYYVQRELESIAELRSKYEGLICDRGSLDGLAYWPSDGTSFLSKIGSTMENEVARYDWVLHLDTTLQSGYQSNHLRIETSREALILNEKIKKAWSEHPRRFVIPSAMDFISKAEKAAEIVGFILEGFSFDEIKSRISSINEHHA